MDATRMFSRALVAIVSLFLVAGLAMGQHLNLSGGNATLSGTWNVKGNINNNTATGVKTFSGTVNMNGTTAAQNVGGTTATQALVFATLNAVGNQVKDQKVTVTVNTAFTNNSGQAYNVGANTLNFGGTTANTSGTFNASNGSSIVNYTSGAAQAVLASTYGGTLGLSGGAKTLGGAVLAAVVNQTAGSITVNNDLTITGTSASSFQTITDITATKTLLKNATGTLTVGTLSANAGTISMTAAGTINFTGSATSTSLISASAGTIDFDATFTNTGGTLDLSGGQAIFGGSFASQAASGTLTLASGTTVTYDGGSDQNAAGANYHHLIMTGAGIKTALAGVNVGGNFTNNSATTDMDTYTLAITGTKSNTGGTVKFGGTNNGVVFATGTVEYNGGDGITQTIKAGTYATLLLSRKSGAGTAAKQIAGDDVVTTTGSMTVPVETSLLLAAGTGSTALNVNVDFNVDGAVTNNGTITVGL